MRPEFVVVAHVLHELVRKLGQIIEGGEGGIEETIGITPWLS
jgi:hypothetical protein